MTRIFHLSHLLDKVGYNRIDLISFYELSKLDEYIERFNSHKDVRKKYMLDISEHCLDNMQFIQDENKRNNHDWTGSIVIICEERDEKDKRGLIHKIPVIYHNSKKLLPKEKCLAIIKEKLDNLNTIITIYEKNKTLLSQNERELVILYTKTHSKHYLKSASGFLYNRLKNIEDDELLYYYCRSLMNIFELNKLSIKTKFGNISNINDSFPVQMELKKYSGFSNDVYFNKLIDDENYEELFNNYDLDEIDHDSDLLKEGRKK